MPTQKTPPQQTAQEHQSSNIFNDNKNDKCNKEEQHQQHQQQQQQQSKIQNLSNHNNFNNSNSNNNNIKRVSNNMEKSLRKSTDKSNASLLSASTQLLKDATVAALMQRNKQCTPTASCSDASFSSVSVADSIQDDMSDQCSLTQAGLEEYNIRASSYYDQPVLFHHQKQSSYAQSEGYHSYVSSSDSSSATPFLDRLRQESEMLSRQSSHHWSQNDLSSMSCASAASSPTPTSLLLSTVSMENGNRSDGLLGDNDLGTTGSIHQQQMHNNNSNSSNNNSSESTSSTETLKWHGSMSDVSEASHATGYSAVSESVSNSQLIVHSSRVLTPKRHHSESVLYLSNEQQQLSPNRSSTNENSQQQFVTHQEEIFNSTHDYQLTTRTSVNHRHSPSYPPVHTTLTLQPYNQHHHHHNHQPEQQQKSYWEENSSSTDLPKSSLIVNKLTAAPTTVTTKSSVGTDTSSASLPSELEQLNQQKQHDFQKSNISVTISSSEAMVTISPRTTAGVTTKSRSERDTSLTTNSVNVELVDDKLKSTSPSALSSLSTTSSHRSNHRLFPVSTYTEHSNTSHFVQHPKPQFSSGLQRSSVQVTCTNNGAAGGDQSKDLTSKNQSQNQGNSWHSVAELINDFERSKEQQPQKYAFMDPNKTQRVSNPALKAIQKNAVQSYFERQQHQHHIPKDKLMQQRSYEQKQQQQFLPQPQQHQQLLRPHSFQALASKKEVDFEELQRSSLPNTYNGHHHHQHQQQQQQLSGIQQKQILNSSNRMAMSSSFTQLSTERAPQESDEDSRRRFPQPASPEPPPPPPRSRSLMPVSLLRRSSSASEYAEFRDQFQSASQEKLQAQSIKNISSAEKSSFNDCGMPPPPPPRARGSLPERCPSSASEYVALRDKLLLQQAAARAHQQHHPHQYNRQPSTQRTSQAISNYYVPTNAASEGWVPERPPKNPNLRIPSPDLPPPPTEIDTSLSDEPLPPPPPEILHRQPYYDVASLGNSSATATTSKLSGVELATQAALANRRNSFAGSSTRKTFFSQSSSHNADANTKIPPVIPKKPSNIEQLHPTRSVILSPQNKQSFLSKAQPQPQQQPAANPPNQSQNRKRPHNPGVIINVPPIPESMTSMNITRCKPASSLPHTTSPTKSAPPPPLKPRNTGASAQSLNGVQMRCNSKASYLPRQSLEKLNSADPDHGSYKLTLTSNEDLVNSTSLAKPVSGSYDILTTHNGKLPNNLPDVLPLGAKLQQPQPASPTGGGNVSPLRYSFGSTSSMTSTQLATSIYPLQHRYSTPSMGTTNANSTYNNNNNSTNTHPTPNYIRSQSYDVNNDMKTNNRTAKFMSQSTIDLKSPKTHTLDTTHEEEISPTIENSKHILSPAQSENNLSDKSRNSIKQPLSPTDVLSNNDMHASTEGRIFRAELVSTTLPGSPALGSASSLNKTIIRKDSLRENIEKITQLQSKLMSAHISDNSFGLSGYGTKTLTQNSTEKLEQNSIECEVKEQKHTKDAITNELEAHEILSKDNITDSVLTSTSTIPPHLPTTPIQIQTAQQTKALESTQSNSKLLTLPTEAIDNEDSLKLMQRSEIILHLNPTMVEASSQTDDLTEDDTEMFRSALPQQQAKENHCTRTTLQPRQRHPIEVDCDKMCKELATLLPSNDKLIDVIMPQLIKTTSDYVSNLYNPNVPLRPTKHDVGTSTLMRMKLKDQSDLKNTMAVELHYAELDLATLSNEAENDGCDMLKQKVDELIKNLKRKIRILGNEQTTIEEESVINDELGSNLLKKFSEKVRPIEATKFRTYIDDIGHITSLLLSLSERLARAENSLLSVKENSAEKKTLESKRDRLFEQLEEAKRLKGDIDRRGCTLTGMLEKNLNADDFADFDYFINMKAKLIADSRDISDKIKSGEEQLNALSDTLVTSDC